MDNQSDYILEHKKRKIQIVGDELTLLGFRGALLEKYGKKLSYSLNNLMHIAYVTYSMESSVISLILFYKDGTSIPTHPFRLTKEKVEIFKKDLSERMELPILSETDLSETVKQEYANILNGTLKPGILDLSTEKVLYPKRLTINNNGIVFVRKPLNKRVEVLFDEVESFFMFFNPFEYANGAVEYKKKVGNPASVGGGGAHNITFVMKTGKKIMFLCPIENVPEPYYFLTTLVERISVSPSN